MPNVFSKPLRGELKTNNWRLAFNDWLVEVPLAPTKGGCRRERELKIKLAKLSLFEEWEAEMRIKNRVEKFDLLASQLKADSLIL